MDGIYIVGQQQTNSRYKATHNFCVFFFIFLFLSYFLQIISVFFYFAPFLCKFFGPFQKEKKEEGERQTNIGRRAAACVWQDACKNLSEMNVKVSIYTPAGLVGYSIFWVFFKRTGKMKEKRIKRTNKWHTRRGGGRLENSPSTEKNKNESAGHTHRFFFSSTTAQRNQRIIFNFVFFSSIQKMIIHRFLKNTHIIES
jgi:hypothetical protein